MALLTLLFGSYTEITGGQVGLGKGETARYQKTTNVISLSPGPSV